MSREALREALWGYKPGYKLTVEEQMAFEFGWNAAMKFTASPRMPLTVEYPHLVGSLDPSSPQFFEDAERPGMMRKGVNPHGLVAFYTDAP